METLLSSRYIFILFALVGLLLGVGFVYPALWWAGLIGVASFITLSVRTSTKRAALGGVLAWTIKSMLVLLWFFTTEPFAWLPAQYSEPAWSTILIFWAYVSLLLGLAGGLVSVGSKQLWQNFRPQIFWAAFPFLWVAGEVLGSLLFSIGTYGEGGSVGVAFSFGYAGYLLAEHGLIAPLAQLGGVYLLSFVSALLACGLWYFATESTLRFRRSAVVGGLLIIIFLAEVSLGENTSLSQESITVAVVETEFTSLMMRDETWAEYRTSVLSRAVKAALEKNPDYLVLPEDARFTPGGGSVATMYDRFRLLYGDSDTVLLDSRAVLVGDGGTVLRAYIFDGLAKQAWSTDKQTLVPAGEYVPYVTKLVTTLLANSLTESLDNNLVYRRGPQASQAQFPAHVPAVLFCFESANPLAVFKLTRERTVPFIAHPISHAMFSAPTQLWWQLDTMLRVQAVFNQVPIVSAGNEAASTLYQIDGSLVRPEIIATGERWQVGLFRW